MSYIIIFIIIGLILHYLNLNINIDTDSSNDESRPIEPRIILPDASKEFENFKLPTASEMERTNSGSSTASDSTVKQDFKYYFKKISSYKDTGISTEETNAWRETKEIGINTTEKSLNNSDESIINPWD